MQFVIHTEPQWLAFVLLFLSGLAAGLTPVFVLLILAYRAAKKKKGLL